MKHTSLGEGERGRFHCEFDCHHSPNPMNETSFNSSRSLNLFTFCLINSIDSIHSRSIAPGPFKLIHSYLTTHFVRSCAGMKVRGVYRGNIDIDTGEL